jgi:hypothetical protein
MINSHWPTGRNKGQYLANKSPTNWRLLSKPLLRHKNISLFATATTVTRGLISINSSYSNADTIDYRHHADTNYSSILYIYMSDRDTEILTIMASAGS